MTAPEWTTGRVPLIDPTTGRFPDSYAPGPVVEALEEFDAIRGDMLAKHANLADVPDAAAARSHLGAAPATHSHSMEQVTGLGAALDAKADLVDGKVPTSQIPDIALGHAVSVPDEAAMLALTPAEVQPGDLAVRADGTGTWMLRDPDPSVVGSWVHLSPPDAPVTTVNGQLGDVVLGAADVGAVTPTQLGEAITGVEVTAEGFAQAAAGSASSAASSATAAATDRGQAQTARTGAETARTGAENARDAAEGFRDETEQTYVLVGPISGSVDLTAHIAGRPAGLDMTLTGDVTATLPDLGDRILTCSIWVQQDATGGRQLTVVGAKASWSVALVHTGTPGSSDLIHLLHYGPRGWVQLSGAQNVGVPS